MLYAGRIPSAEMSDQVDQSYERQYRRCIAGAWGSNLQKTKAEFCEIVERLKDALMLHHFS